MSTSIRIGLFAACAAGAVAASLALSPTRPADAVAQPAPPAPTVAPDWNDCADLDPRGAPHACPQATCGSNTPLVNPFPVDGLHAGGCRNPDGHRLVPGSLEKGLGQCPAVAMTLDRDADGQLVGRDAATGAVRCQGPALVGAIFTVEATRAPDVNGQPGPPLVPPQPRQIMVSSMAAIAVANRDVPAYVFSPVHAPAQSLCDRIDSPAWIAGWIAGTPPAAPLARPVVTGGAVRQVTAAERGRYAILVGGDVFDRRGNPFDLKQKRHWFNVACADGALAKLRLEGLDDAATEPAVRKAALKMLTAKYVDGLSQTVNGVAIEWRRGAARGRGVEARWSEHGATCISHARMWRPNAVLPAELMVPECRTVTCDEPSFVGAVARGLPSCDAAYTPAAPEHWTSYVVDHVDDAP